MGWIADLLNEIPSAAHYKIQLEQLVSEHDKLKSEKSVFKDKIDALELQLQTATKEIERLNQVIQGLKKDNTQQHLNTVTKKTLKHFFDADRTLSVNDFVSILSLKTNIIEYHFDILLKNDLITQNTMTARGGYPRYSLTSKGREYIIKNPEE